MSRLPAALALLGASCSAGWLTGVYAGPWWQWAVGLGGSAGLMALALTEGAVLATLDEVLESNRTAREALRSATPEQRARLGLSDLSPTTTVSAETVALHPAVVRWTVARLPLDPERLRLFAQGVLAGAPMSIRRWAGRGRLMSDPEYRRLMAVMERRGYALLRNPDAPRVGHDLSDRGRAVLKVASTWVRPE